MLYKIEHHIIYVVPMGHLYFIPCIFYQHLTPNGVIQNKPYTHYITILFHLIKNLVEITYW